MTRAVDLARRVDWPHWKTTARAIEVPILPVEERGIPGFVFLDPEHCLDHALALAEHLWPRVDSLSLTLSFGDQLWCLHVWDGTSLVGLGESPDAPCEAICRAIEAATEEPK